MNFDRDLHEKNSFAEIPKNLVTHLKLIFCYAIKMIM